MSFKSLFLIITRTNKKKERIHKFKVNFHNYLSFVFLYREIFVKQEYFIPIKKTPLILDCGSNIGLSVLFFKLFYPCSVIHAFEPLPENYNLLEKNILQNKLKDVKSYNVAISNKDSYLKLYYSKEDIANSNLRSSVFSERSNIDLDVVIVKSISLSNFIDKLDQIDILKMDIEGAEFSVFENLTKKNVLSKINHILLEVHHNVSNNKLSKLLDILEKNNFIFYLDSSLTQRKGYQDILLYAKNLKFPEDH